MTRTFNIFILVSIFSKIDPSTSLHFQQSAPLGRKHREGAIIHSWLACWRESLEKCKLLQALGGQCCWTILCARRAINIDWRKGRCAHETRMEIGYHSSCGICRWCGSAGISEKNVLGLCRRRGVSTQELHRYLRSLGKKRHQWNINLLILALDTVMMSKW